MNLGARGPLLIALVALAAALLSGVLVGCGGTEEAGPPASVRTDTAGPVPGATVGTTPLTTPEDVPVPELAVPIVDAEVAVDVLIAAVEDAYDPEAPDWGVPNAWREVAPGLVFAGPATEADPETLSGVEVVITGDGRDAMGVAVADEDGRCAAFVVLADNDRVTTEYAPEPDVCTGEAVLQLWEATAAESAAVGAVAGPAS